MNYCVFQLSIAKGTSLTPRGKAHDPKQTSPYACMHTCPHACMHTRTHAHMHSQMHAHAHANAHADNTQAATLSPSQAHSSVHADMEDALPLPIPSQEIDSPERGEERVHPYRHAPSEMVACFDCVEVAAAAAARGAHALD